ncbi:RES family NAD+ phosphorylase [Terracidiphilus sp.]|uniref:RES family NAD+ phosphorylase n=1 Tax=Terracidiphilus sp. TaxID=1964191 RepID=UPI003C18C2F0
MACAALFEKQSTHRLVPAKYSETGSVLEALPLPNDVLSDLSELDAATNERTQAERAGNPAIGPGELLFGVPEAQIVNAAFCHPGPYGSRFNTPQRGAWYAGVELETSCAEVAFHRRRLLEETRFSGEQAYDYQDFLADFSGEFHQLDEAEQKTCLEPEPVPQCYAPGQALAETLLYQGAQGIVYPSVRNPGGTCIVCFRPALIFHLRRAKRYRIAVIAGKAGFRIEKPAKAGFRIEKSVAGKGSGAV